MAEHLPSDQAALVRMVYGAGRPVAELARVAGVPERTMRRRVEGIVSRCTSREFALVVLAGSGAGELEGVALGAARLCVVEGRSVREAARALGVSQHAVRTGLAAVRGAARFRVQGAKLR
jgi:DNA-directed RNA polymerase specialized sigma24 family protein